MRERVIFPNDGVIDVERGTECLYWAPGDAIVVEGVACGRPTIVAEIRHGYCIVAMRAPPPGTEVLSLATVLPVGTRVGIGKWKATAVTPLVLGPWEGKRAYEGQVRWPDGTLSYLDAHWLPEWIAAPAERDRVELLPEEPILEWCFSRARVVQVGNQITVKLGKDQDPGFVKLCYRSVSATELALGRVHADRALEVTERETVARPPLDERALRRQRQIAQCKEALGARVGERYREEDFPPVTLKPRGRS